MKTPFSGCTHFCSTSTGILSASRPKPRAGMVVARLIIMMMLMSVGAAVWAEVNVARLWVSPSNVHLRPFLQAAAQRALEHPECQEVLYGGINEFRSERGETSFTILCLKDDRNTFNLVVKQADLAPVVEETPRPDSRQELERLRQLLQTPAAAAAAPAPASEAESEEVLEDEAEPDPESNRPPEIF